MIISRVDLQAHWSFDGDSLHDFSGNGRDLTNLTNLAFADGISDKALSFVDRSIIRAAYGAAINFSAETALSISWWCNKTAAATINALVFCFALSSADGVYAYCPVGTDNLTLRFNCAAGIEEVTVTSVLDTTLRHFVLTFYLPTKAWVLYRNGTWAGGGTLISSPVMPNRSFILGNYNTPVAASGWIGLIDEVRLYSRVLTPTEALALKEDPAQNIPTPAPIIPRSTDDLLLDNVVTILQAFSAAQAAMDPTVAFNVVRGQRRPASLSQLPLVNVWLESTDPQGAAARTCERERGTVNLDCIVRGEEDGGSSDQDAEVKLAYLKEQVKAGLWALAQADFGFTAGSIAVKGWPRWQAYKDDNGDPEEQVVGGRWTFEVDFEWLPSEVTREALTELRLTERIKLYAPEAGVNATYP